MPAAVLDRRRAPSFELESPEFRRPSRSTVLRHRFALVSLCAVLVFTSACRTSGPADSDNDQRAAQRATDLDREREYEGATTAEELDRFVRQDLESRSADRAAAGLEAFVFTSLFEERATHASEIYKKAKPALLFQRLGGQSRIATVTALGDMLAIAAKRELTGIHAAIRLGDNDALGRARTNERAVLSGETLALAPHLVPHAEYVDGVLAYRRFESAPTPGGQAEVVAPLARAIEAFAQTRQEEPHFVALILTAQAHELGGDRTAAIEAWLRAGESSYYKNAHRDLRLAIDTRIETHVAAVRAEVEAAVAAEWEKRLADQKRAAAAEAEIAKTRVASLEKDLAAARAEYDALAVELESERFENAQQLERAAAANRIAQLETQLEDARRTLELVLAGKLSAAPVAATSPSSSGSVMVEWQAQAKN